MSAPRDKADRPSPGSRDAGNNVGGVLANADGGLADAAQRSMERADTAMGRASTGDASGGAHDPRLDLGGTNEPGAADTPLSHSGRPRSDDRATPRADETAATAAETRPGAPSGRTNTSDDDDEDAWRHEPVAPVDEENPLKSLGRAVADTITSGDESEAEKRKR
jgi:hypothetical protein